MPPAVNSFKNTSFVASELLRHLLNRLGPTRFANHEAGRKYFLNNTMKSGGSVQVPFPQRVVTQRGSSFQPQPISNQTATLTVQEPFTAGFNLSSVEDAINFSGDKANVSEKLIKPTGEQLAQDIDSAFALFCTQNSPNIIGALNVPITAWQTYHDANARLDALGCPTDEDQVLNLATPAQIAAIAGSTATLQLFAQNKAANLAFNKSAIGKAANADWIRTNSLYTQTAGTAETATVSGANQSGNTLIIQGTAGQTIPSGSRFTMANVYSVHPGTRRSTGTLSNQQTVGDVTLVSGDNTLTLVPDVQAAIVGPGTGLGNQYQNVDALPGDGVTITFWPGTTSPSGKTGRIGLEMQSDAYAFGGLPLMTPWGINQMFAQETDPETGIQLRIWAWSDGLSDMHNVRVDALCYFGALYVHNCVMAIAGAA